MKHCIAWVAFVTLLLGSGVSCARPLTNQERAKIVAGYDKLTAASLAGDVAAYEALMDPKLAEVMGGKEIFRRLMTETMKNDSAMLDSSTIKVEGLGDVIKADGAEAVFMRTLFIMKVDGQFYRMHGTALAIKRPGSATWRYAGVPTQMDSKRLLLAKIYHVPDDVKIPEDWYEKADANGKPLPLPENKPDAAEVAAYAAQKLPIAIDKHTTLVAITGQGDTLHYNFVVVPELEADNSVSELVQVMRESLPKAACKSFSNFLSAGYSVDVDYVVGKSQQHVMMRLNNRDCQDLAATN